MNKRSRVSLDNYYTEAESWSADREAALRNSRSVAWKVATGAAVLALLLAVALTLLLPLKKEVPHLLLVDRHTGYVQSLDALDERKLTANWALTQSLLAQYVIARESYEIDSVQLNYRKVALWSAEKARSDYLASMQASSPQSPLVRYPRDAIVETQVKSVSAVGRNVAMVRFDTQMRSAGAASATSVASWVALIRYRYSGEPMALEDRLVNPLGFQVVRYRKDQEALPVVVQSVPPQPAAVLVAPPQQPQAAPPRRAVQPPTAPPARPRSTTRETRATENIVL